MAAGGFLESGGRLIYTASVFRIKPGELLTVRLVL